jgi:hypothetical protein
VRRPKLVILIASVAFVLKADGRTACLAAARHSRIAAQARGAATAFQGTLAFPWQVGNYIDRRRWPAWRGRVGMVRTQRIALTICHSPTIATAAWAIPIMRPLGWKGGFATVYCQIPGCCS